MKFYTEINNFYILPALRVYYDTYFEGDLMYLDLELSWLKWGVGVRIIKEK